jgi:hypothetical protein
VVLPPPDPLATMAQRKVKALMFMTSVSSAIYKGKQEISHRPDQEVIINTDMEKNAASKSNRSEAVDSRGEAKRKGYSRDSEEWMNE